MVQSVELLLDPRLEAQVRREWDTLSAAGLPSQNRHTSASNRPHVTVGVARSITRGVDEDMADLFCSFPIRLGGLVVFGGGAATLARLVVPSTALMVLHGALHDAMGGASEFAHLAPGAWTPHVTLARRLTTEQVAAAVSAVTPGLEDLLGSAVSLRRWDGDAKEDWIIG